MPRHNLLLQRTRSREGTLHSRQGTKSSIITCTQAEATPKDPRVTPRALRATAAAAIIPAAITNTLNSIIMDVAQVAIWPLESAAD